MNIDYGKIITSIAGTVIAALLTYAGSTLYQLDKDVNLIKYQIEQSNMILQDLYEHKKDR